MRRLVAAAAVGVLVLSGCTAKQPSGLCQEYPMDRAQEILQAGMTANRAASVVSTDHKKAWYVAIEFSGPGVDHEVGVWATNDIEGGSIVSVDSIAEGFSSFPKMDSFSVTDVGVDRVKSCLGK